MGDQSGYLVVERPLPAVLREALVADAEAYVFAAPHPKAGGAFAMASLAPAQAPARAAQWIADAAVEAGFSEFVPNEASYQRYRPGGNGLPPHRDQRYYTTCIAIVTLSGEATFAVHASRDRLDVVREWTTRSGQVVLLRGYEPGCGVDTRPYHRVDPPTGGPRLMFQLRHNVAAADPGQPWPSELTDTEADQAHSLAATPEADRAPLTSSSPGTLTREPGA